MYDVVIVGSGTAGMTAAIYVQRAGKKALVLDEAGFGGQIVFTSCIENYPGIQNVSGPEFADGLHKQAEELGAEFKVERVISIEKKEKAFSIITGVAIYEAKSVIVATGVKSRKLGIEGEEKLVGSGVSYCATCDGNFFKGRDIAVVGGGNTALEDAEVMSGIANKVYLVHRRDEFRGEQLTVERLKTKDNVEFVLNSKPVEVVGNFAVEGLKVLNTLDNKERMLEVSGVFVAVGHVPDNKAFEKFINLDPQGFVDAGENCRTNIDGIFAAGDCRNKKVRQLITAAGDAAVAAVAAIEHANKV